MENYILKNYDSIDLMEKRISYLLGARLRNKDSIKQAIQKQNEIKRKHKAIINWNSVAQIRKWRETK